MLVLCVRSCSCAHVLFHVDINGGSDEMLRLFTAFPLKFRSHVHMHVWHGVYGLCLRVYMCCTQYMHGLLCKICLFTAITL